MTMLSTAIVQREISVRRLLIHCRIWLAWLRDWRVYLLDHSPPLILGYSSFQKFLEQCQNLGELGNVCHDMGGDHRCKCFDASTNIGCWEGCLCGLRRWRGA